MTKVLVVDDERHIVDHIVRLMEREPDGRYTVCGTAGSGREALEKAASLAPDLIVLDVRMPGLSGLDTVRELRRRGIQAAVILATAYERFDIAREALELGISGYLLKPVVRDDLLRALASAADTQDRAAAGTAGSRWEQEEELRSLAAAAFLTQLALGSVDAAVAREAGRRLTGGREWGVVAAVSFSSGAGAAWASVDAGLGYKSEALVGPRFGSRGLLFLPVWGSDGAVDRQAGVEAAVRSLATGGPAAVFGWSDPAPLADLSGGWAQALTRLADTPGTSGGFEAGESFLSALNRGDPEVASRSLDDLLGPLETAPLVPVDLRYRLASLLGTALIRLEAQGRLEPGAARHWLDFTDLTASGSGSEVCRAVRLRLPVLTSALGSGRRAPELSAALDYVGRQFGQPLTLESVAEAVGLSAKRLSKLFIDETGLGFTDYLIDYRIGKAKVLLAQPGHSIKMVSADCGYPDPNYFARLFKKVTGLTPTEFSSQS